MPKTQINFPVVTPLLMLEDPNATGDDTTIQVGWNKEVGWVQVGMEVDIDYAQFAIDSPNGKTDKRTLLYTPVLGPKEIDKMISALRKAKRKVYGE